MICSFVLPELMTRFLVKNEGINRNQAVFRIFVAEDGPTLVYFKYIKGTLDRESKSVDAESPFKKN